MQWYDPQTATWLAEKIIPTETGVLTLAIPKFSRDIAAKITFVR